MNSTVYINFSDQDFFLFLFNYTQNILLKNVVQYLLSRRRIGRIEKPGSCYPANSSEGETEAKDVFSNSIRRASVKTARQPDFTGAAGSRI